MLPRTLQLDAVNRLFKDQDSLLMIVRSLLAADHVAEGGDTESYVDPNYQSLHDLRAAMNSTTAIYVPVELQSSEK